MKRVALIMALALLAAGCGRNPVAPPAEAPGARIHAVGDADGGALVPPVKAENYLAPEPDKVELGPVG